MRHIELLNLKSSHCCYINRTYIKLKAKYKYDKCKNNKQITKAFINCKISLLCGISQKYIG